MSFTLARYCNRVLEHYYQKRQIKPSVLKNLKVLEGINMKSALSEIDYVVVDTELTGLDVKQDSLLSIGAVNMRGTRIQMGMYFYRVINPCSCVKPSTVVIHGITPQEASECPSVDLILPEFIDFCKDKVIVGHCVSIDIGFINKEMKRLYGFRINNPVIDTLKLYWWLNKKRLGYDAFAEDSSLGTSSLFDIAKEFDVPVQEGHNAISDAFMTAQVFQRFIPALSRRGIDTLDSLIRIGKP